MTASRAARRCPLGTMAVAAVGCATASVSAPAPTERERTTFLTTTCRENIEGPELARFAGSTCPWVLLVGPGEDDVRLGSLDRERAASFAGAMPPGCTRTRCRFQGITTSAGPILVVTAVSPWSEIPDGAWIGLAVDPGMLAFIDLWLGAGEPVMSDYTPVGPAFSLAPRLCDDRLAFAIVARLPVARHAEPPPELLAREGTYTVRDGELVQSGPLPEGCVPLSVPEP